MPTDRRAFLKLARDRFAQAQTAEKDQRERELQDLRFYAGDQWPEDVRTIRAGQNASNGLPPVPARPCLTINKTREPVRQVLNQERQSDMGIEIVAADDFGELVGPIDDTEIKLREGLVRRIQRESSAEDARTWAFARATIAGRGFYGVMTRYVPGKTNDQEIFVHRYYNQSCVTLDPAHEQPDGSDAEWAIIGTDYTQDQYNAEFKKRNGRNNAVCGESDDQFRARGDEAPDWFRSEGETRIYRVVDYWYTVRVSRELVTYEGPDGSQIVEWADEVPEAPMGYVELPDSRRAVVEKQIKWAKLDGCDDDVLEETDWLGPDMPIVKVLGEELQPYDDKRRVEGMVRPMREPGQGFNVMVSSLVERIGLMPLPPLMVAEGQTESYEEWYKAANTRTLPYLPYRQKDVEGQQAPPPFAVDRGMGSVIGPIGQSIQLFDEALQATSGIHDPSLGKVDPSVKSGRAIKALQEQSARSSNHFLDNLQRSIRYEGQIINNLLYPIYGRPGRIARIINGEGDAEHVLLHQPMILRNGRPVPAPDPTSPNAKTYTLTKDAKFNVIIKVSKSFDSRREQEATIVGEMIAQNPELMTWFGDLYFANLDGPGHQQMADRAKLMLAPPIQQMLQQKSTEAGSLPPEVQAQMAQMQAQNQQLQQMLQQAMQQIQTDAVKVEGDLQKTQMQEAAEDQRSDRKLKSEIILKHMDNAAKIEIARISAAKQAMDAEAQAMEERIALGLSHQQERELAESGREHERDMQAREVDAAERARTSDQAHQASMADRQAAREAESPRE